ncbi:MAG: SGNH/GDSL hydrolase family protein [Pseudomonadota bacterium]
MTWLKKAILSACVFILAGCVESVTRADNPRILLMGDSLMAIHGLSGNAVADAMERHLGEPVIDRSVIGARFIYPLPISGAAGLNITKQYREGEWDWIVVNGGGNDILFGCGCGPCARKIDRLISEDGRKGVIPGFIGRMRSTGAKVIYVGYLRTPGTTSLVEFCVDEGRKMDERAARLAKLDDDVYFVALSDLVPYGDFSFHALDTIHPSIKGSEAIGQRLANLIRDPKGFLASYKPN